MIIRRLGLAIGAAALMLTGLSAPPAMAEDPVGPTAYTGCKNGLYFAGGATGYKAWAKCSMAGGHDFYAFARCSNGVQRTGPTYPTTGKYTSWTVGGCVVKPSDYGQHIVN